MKKWLCLALLAACGDEASAQRDLDAMVDAMPADAAVAADAQALDASSRCSATEQRMTGLTNYHQLGDLMYSDPPPVGGNHNPCWTTWGVHEDEVPDERWVHNLEHGGVVFLYHCPDGCKSEVDTMKSYVTGRERALLTSYSLMPTRFAVVSWGVRLTADCLDMPAFMQFYETNVGHGLENVTSDPPRSCDTND